jgi:hypothetical protein
MPWKFYNGAMRWQIVIFLLLVGVLFTRLDSANAENISKSPYPSENVNIAINASGEIGAVWVEKFSTGNQQVYFAIRRSGTWSTPEVIPGQSGISAYPRIAKGVTGGFVAVWHDQTIDCIRFSKYQGSWSTPITVSQVGGHDFGWPALTTTTNGRIAVAWMRGDPLFSDIFVTVYQNSWSSPVNVSNTQYGSKYCDLAYGPNGEIYVVWQDDRGEDYFRPLMNNDQGNGNWMKSSEINNIQGWCFRPVMAVNSRNDILSCFYFHNGASYWGSYRLNNSWQSPQVISDVGNHHDHDFYFSDVSPYEEDGFLYIYRDSAYNIFYIAAREGKLGKAVALTNNSQSYYPSIDYSTSQGAVAAWTDRSGNCDVFVAIFDPQNGTFGDGIQPPLSVVADYRKIALEPTELKTEMVVNRNLFTVQYFWKISWAFDTRWTDWKLTLSKYRIYRKLKTAVSWELLAEIDPSALLHIDKNGVFKEDRFDYKVRGVDNLGNEFYAYNRISWAPNPVNSDRKITVQGYNTYRKPSGQSSSSFALWKTVDTATNALEDHSTEIRQQIEFDYALTSVSDTGKESVKAGAQKITSSTPKTRRP